MKEPRVYHPVYHSRFTTRFVISSDGFSERLAARFAEWLATGFAAILAVELATRFAATIPVIVARLQGQALLFTCAPPFLSSCRGPLSRGLRSAGFPPSSKCAFQTCQISTLAEFAGVAGFDPCRTCQTCRALTARRHCALILARLVPRTITPLGAALALGAMRAVRARTLAVEFVLPFFTWFATRRHANTGAIPRPTLPGTLSGPLGRDAAGDPGRDLSRVTAQDGNPNLRAAVDDIIRRPTRESTAASFSWSATEQIDSCVNLTGTAGPPNAVDIGLDGFGRSKLITSPRPDTSCRAPRHQWRQDQLAALELAQHFQADRLLHVAMQHVGIQPVFAKPVSQIFGAKPCPPKTSTTSISDWAHEAGYRACSPFTSTVVCRMASTVSPAAPP